MAKRCNKVLPTVGNVLGSNYVCGRDFINGLYTRHPSLGRMKTSSIDPKRAKKATCEVRDAWFDLQDNAIKELYENKEVPWASMKDVPAAAKLNMDEGAYT